MYRSRTNASRTPGSSGRRNLRRWQVAGVGAVAVAIVGVGLGVASAAESTPTPTVNCPGVAGSLPAVPAQSQAEVQRNLALLNTQIAEANNRLATTVGQGGANFIQNAILGPLKDKRVSTIDRIVISIGRHATKPSLDENALATCTLNNGGAASATEPTNVAVAATSAAAASGSTAATPTVNCPGVAGSLPAVPAQAQAEVQRNLALLNTQIAEANNRLATTVGEGGPNFIQNAILGPLKDKRVATINRIATAIGRNAAKPNLDVNTLAPCTLNAAGAAAPAAEPTVVPSATAAGTSATGTTGTTAAAPTVNCPALTGLPSIPAQAQAEVTSNLALLQTQIAEANNRLATTVGQGGANFIQNAILGPLKDKRVATINRIATAIGRNAAKPDLNVAAIAPCTLNK